MLKQQKVTIDDEGIPDHSTREYQELVEIGEEDLNRDDGCSVLNTVLNTSMTYMNMSVIMRQSGC